MRKIFFLVISFIMFLTLAVSAEPAKISTLNYDDSGEIVYINVNQGNDGENFPQKYVRLENPNRIYFDINNAVLIGPKQQLAFEKINIKEIRLAQFSTEPNIVRVVITFEEDFDATKVKLLNINGNIVVKMQTPALKNDYFNLIYDENPSNLPYSGIVVNSQVVQKTAIPQTNFPENKENAAIMEDISKAFASSTLNNTDGKTYDSIISIDLSSDLKLRTKYYINGYYFKNGGLLVSGLGQMTAAKTFMLDSPKRVVIDLPNTYVDKKIRNKEISLCPDGSCKDTAKIGQFEFNRARIVVTTDKQEKYIPIYSADAQSMFLVNSEKLDHTKLANAVANISKVYERKIDSKTNELIFSFTAPVVHSIIRDNNQLAMYMFNVKNYNEPDVIKTLKNSYYKNMTLSLLPQIGVKSELKINKEDIVQISQSVDGKAIKVVIKQSDKKSKNDDKNNSESAETPKRPPIKNKVVLDAGHGGSDYGAIREGINEKDINLDLAQRVASILKSKGYTVAMTRNDDTFVSLEDRVDYSENENPEIFVSIHVNSAVATEPTGIETHYYHEYSRDLADVIQTHLMKEIETKDRGLLKSKFYVINHTTVPAVLVETGFISNADERAELITEARKQKTAKAIAEGIIEYLKKKK